MKTDGTDPVHCLRSGFRKQIICCSHKYSWSIFIPILVPCMARERICYDLYTYHLGNSSNSCCHHIQGQHNEGMKGNYPSCLHTAFQNSERSDQQRKFIVLKGKSFPGRHKSNGMNLAQQTYFRGYNSDLLSCQSVIFLVSYLGDKKIGIRQL